jgi:hypothetical protein
MGGMKNAYKIFVGKSAEKRPRGRPECRWKDNIKLYLEEMGLKNVDCVYVAQHGF